MKKYLVLLLLLLPSFSLMLRLGMHSMHDFHPFRLHQFINCGAFPCRWATDAGAGYGEPVFNYYGQLPYWVGSIFYFSGFSILSSTKLVFIISIVLSAYFMYRLGGLTSAVFYTYAPYRAVDIWVRGALPEALAFVFFPLILLFPNIFLLSLAIAGLIITHNLSAMMFLPFAFIYAIFKKQTVKFIYASIIGIFLSAFYLVPLYWEKNLVSLNQFTQDLYQFQIHYTTLNQLFVSHFWGFGSSVWGVNDNMSFSVGHLHWILGLLAILFGIIRKNKIVILAGTLGFIAIFLTHGRSEFVWKLFNPLSFLQFPWRFLSISTFFLSLSVGYFKKYSSFLTVLLLLLNVSFFSPDQWINKTDAQYFSGDFWDTQRFASLLDYWPTGAMIPNQIAPPQPIFAIGQGNINNYQRNNSSALANMTATTDSLIEFPIVNFPGWSAKVNGQSVSIIPRSGQKLVSVKIPPGESVIALKFRNTLPRHIGNLLSLTSLILLLIYYEKHILA